MKRIDYLLAGSAFVSFLLYFFTNTPRTCAYQLTIMFDHMLPLVPVFVIPYLSFHFFLIPTTIIFLYQQHKIYLLRLFLLAAIIILLSSNLCFIIVPTEYILRPEIIDDTLCCQLIRFIYSIDPPCAACPSIHTNISLLCAIFWYKLKSKLSWFMIMWAALIILSTLLIKQHYIIDVLGGIISTGSGYWIAKYCLKRFS